MITVVTENVYRDTVIYRDLPKECHPQMAVDTSRVETSLAESTAYLDTATKIISTAYEIRWTQSELSTSILRRIFTETVLL